jgi:hypothetical protein
MPAVGDNAAMQSEPSTADLPERKRRRFQFRLPSLIVFSGSILLSACHPTNTETGDQQNAPIERRDVAVATVDNPAETPASPVTASVRVDKTEVRRGEDFTLLIDVQIAAGWHIYPIDHRAGAAALTKIRLQLPKGLESTEKWTSPEPVLSPPLQGEPVFVYEGNSEFRCPVSVLQDAPLTNPSVRCTLVYQACDQFSCRPTAEITLETKVHVIP